jgi:hypothetical protein
METAEWWLPVRRSEAPTGYSSAGCSPAELASASPVTDGFAQKIRKFDTLFVQPLILPKNGV